jgi:hypothetical protein
MCLLGQRWAGRPGPGRAGSVEAAFRFNSNAARAAARRRHRREWGSCSRRLQQLQHDIFSFLHKNSLFRHNLFSTLFFSMKEAESGEIVIVSCIIDFKDKQV